MWPSLLAVTQRLVGSLTFNFPTLHNNKYNSLYHLESVKQICESVNWPVDLNHNTPVIIFGQNLLLHVLKISLQILFVHGSEN